MASVGLHSVILTGILCLGPVFSLVAQPADYQKLWANDWQKAEMMAGSAKSFMKDKAAGFDMPLQELIAIVFPELVRYSAIRDKVEIVLLKSLYVYKGEEFADFSVGIFQIKPSFAEKIRKEAGRLDDPAFANLFKPENDFASEKEFRGSVVAELENPESAFNYVLAFYKICESRFAGIAWPGHTEKVRFYATAYNCGFDFPETYIRQMMHRKFFTIKHLKQPPYYAYADVAVSYYQKQKKDQPLN
jgi:hypothetical protein